MSERIGLAMPVFADSEASDGLKIDKAGTYTLTGSMQGSVIVDPGEGEVTLILDDISIDSCEENACIDYDGELYINKDVSIDCGCGCSCGCSSDCD